MFPRLIGDTSERDRFRHGLTMLLDGAARLKPSLRESAGEG